MGIVLAYASRPRRSSPPASALPPSGGKILPFIGVRYEYGLPSAPAEQQRPAGLLGARPSWGSRPS